MIWVAIFSFSILFIAAIINAFKNQNIGSYNFLCLSLIILTLLLFVGPLGYTIGGQYLVLKEKVERIETKNKELQKVVETLTKMIYVANEAYVTFGGTPKARSEKLEEYKKSIEEYLPPDFEEKLSRDLKELSPQ